MIARADFEAYCRAVAVIVNAATRTSVDAVLAWASAHPGASVADTREAAIGILEGSVRAGSEDAAALAAEWYDEQAAAAHAKLPAAVTETTYSQDALEQMAHYQARKLSKGDAGGFARSCGDWVADQVRRSVNDTVMANAARDRREGVRFARVPTGSETCAFCFMLATRGAVYHTREKAGELGQYHRHCDCKIVPGFEDDPHAELVEGWRPDEALDRLREVEREAGARCGSDWKSNDAVTRVMALKDRGWLYEGRQPATDYSANPRSAYGTLRHKSDGFDPEDYLPDNVTHRGNEWRDLFAHDALAHAGYAVQTRGHEDIDLVMAGEPWEVKSPEGGTGLRFVESNLRSAQRQFKKRGLGNARVVFNTLYRGESDEAIVEEIRRRMPQHDIDQVIVIGKDGKTRLLKNDGDGSPS